MTQKEWLWTMALSGAIAFAPITGDLGSSDAEAAPRRRPLNSGMNMTGMNMNGLSGLKGMSGLSGSARLGMSMNPPRRSLKSGRGGTAKIGRSSTTRRGTGGIRSGGIKAGGARKRGR